MVCPTRHATNIRIWLEAAPQLAAAATAAAALK